MTRQFEEINQKVLGKEGKLKRYRKYRQNKTFQNNEKKFYQQVVLDGTKTYQQPDARETKQFWSKIWQPREDKKSRMDKQHRKRVKRLEEGPKVKIHIYLLKTLLEKCQIRKCQAMMAIMDFD